MPKSLKADKEEDEENVDLPEGSVFRQIVNAVLFTDSGELSRAVIFCIILAIVQGKVWSWGGAAYEGSDIAAIMQH